MLVRRPVFRLLVVAASMALVAALQPALVAIADAPPPAPYAHVPRLLGDLRAGMEAQRLLLQERRELQGRVRRAERLERLPGIRHALRVKRSRPARVALQVARPVKRRLLGH